jgi:ribosome-binding factor A
MAKPGWRDKKAQSDDADAPFSVDAWETPGLRVQRLEHLMFEELDRLFRFEVSDPRLADVVPTSIQMSPDLRNAKVYYALRKSEPTRKRRGPAAPKTPAALKAEEAAMARAVQEALVRVTPFLRVRLADALVVKRLPDLHFHRDRLAESSLRAGALLQEPTPPSRS